MSFVAISFPVSTGPSNQRKTESQRRATKFAESLGVKEDLDLVVIREGVYGYVFPSDVDDAVFKAASKHGGKVTPYVESEAPAVKEGQWIKLESAVLGVRFKMSGTTASDPMEGKVLPGKYFVLGLQESNGGVYATLGRVDKLAEIGRQGPGRYTYNVDLAILRESLVDEKVGEVKTESVKVEKKEEAHDRTDEILDILLENDPWVIAENKRQAAKDSGEELEPTLEDMIAAQVDTSNAEAPVDEIVEEKEEEAELVESAEEEAPAETKEEEDGFDPELYAESRAIADALTEAGFDLDNMTEAELDKVVADLLSEQAEEEEKPAEETEEAPKEEAEDADDGLIQTEETPPAKPADEDEQGDDAFEVAEEK